MARKAKKMAAALIKISTDHHKHFILTQHEFKAISGRKKMQRKFLSTVDALLRKKGYVLIDLHKELELIGVIPIEKVTQWDIPKIQDDIPENNVPQEDEEKDDDKVFNT
jgi:hypothetical protein